jgi:uncharacterized protein (DUF2252 family)
MTRESRKLPRPAERASVLSALRNAKIARSAHAYVRGNTVKFYEWLASLKRSQLPQGPSIWICGDCHIGNLGPIANTAGEVEIQIRDLDQTVVGNPAHDLIRLGLSLAAGARGSDLSGVTTAKMLEHLIASYARALDGRPTSRGNRKKGPESIRDLLQLAESRSWKQLAKERIRDTKPTIPLGKRFWPISRQERREIANMFEGEEMRRLAVLLRSRDDDASIELLDAAYWMKGCSSLGRLRFAILLGIEDKPGKTIDYCLMDVKEAVKATAPYDRKAKMPRDNGQRVIEGARQLSPYIGERIRAARFLNRSVFIRELRPQDMKPDIERLSPEEAVKLAAYLAAVVGSAHGRQMDSATREAWRKECGRNRSKTLDAPSWLWCSVVDLLIKHEGAYLEHCRKYALDEPSL